MIIYDISLPGIFSRVTNFTGSVFPGACVIAFLPALTAFLIKIIRPELFSWIGNDLDQAWQAFSFFVGFLLVFRTTQAYNRFWDGCESLYRMGAEWQDCGSNLIAFTKFTDLNKVSQDVIMEWSEIIATLLSMLHASAIISLRYREGEDGEFGLTNNMLEMYIKEQEAKDNGMLEQFEKNLKQSYLDYEDEHLFLKTSDDMCDPKNLDEKARATLRELAIQDRVNILIGWVQVHIVNGIKQGILSIAPPILTRAFQELNGGQKEYHNALKVAEVPFPFPYAQICDTLLLMHATLVPVVSSNWIADPLLAALFTFVQVLVLWSLNLVAAEIEMPFGDDANDLDLLAQQNQFNRRMLILLTDEAKDPPSPVGAGITVHHEGHHRRISKKIRQEQEKKKKVEEKELKAQAKNAAATAAAKTQQQQSQQQTLTTQNTSTIVAINPSPPVIRESDIDAMMEDIEKEETSPQSQSKLRADSKELIIDNISNAVNSNTAQTGQLSNAGTREITDSFQVIAKIQNQTVDDLIEQQQSLDTVSEASRTTFDEHNRHISARKKLKQIDQANTYYIRKEDHIFNMIKDICCKSRKNTNSNLSRNSAINNSDLTNLSQSESAVNGGPNGTNSNGKVTVTKTDSVKSNLGTASEKYKLNDHISNHSHGGARWTSSKMLNEHNINAPKHQKSILIPGSSD